MDDTDTAGTTAEIARIESDLDSVESALADLDAGDLDQAEEVAKALNEGPPSEA